MNFTEAKLIDFQLIQNHKRRKSAAYRKIFKQKILAFLIILAYTVCMLLDKIKTPYGFRQTCEEVLLFT